MEKQINSDRLRVLTDEEIAVIAGGMGLVEVMVAAAPAPAPEKTDN
jgi:hypothetical protein